MTVTDLRPEARKGTPPDDPRAGAPPGDARHGVSSETAPPIAEARPGVKEVLERAARARRPRKIAGRIFWTLVILGLVGGAAAWWTTRSVPVTTYTSRPVTQGGLVVTVTATGSLYPTNQVEVGSEQSGTVRTVAVDYNSRVAKGDVLAELDTDRLAAAVESAAAKLAAAEANVAEADATIAEKKGDLDRKTVLQQRSVISSQELETARAAHDRAVAARRSALAQVSVAAADLRVAETNLAKTRILSPIDGVVLTRSVDPGQTVAASLQAPVLFTLAEDLAQMELRVDVDEADVGRVDIGQAATFTVDAYPERTFPAVIRDVRYASETTQNVVTYKALLTVDNSDLSLRPGMTATADIVVETVENALLVDNAALRFTPPESAADGGANAGLFRFFMPRPPAGGEARPPSVAGSERILYVDRGGAPEPVPVTIGSTDGRLTVIRSGDVKPGDRAVVDYTTQ
ncbi:efflux RND transporter periplasmic adaptor subunit [Mongoliimonas terrestris]|uniref:efflux RND transporter periplasmic adaptor subunit n=1 Tax=Mongoliimonas terrestris TaxID=1709001 RepID=UPI0009F8A54A|nr:efflux RND transporter periplasmic adaptor subunit [Mongoliimonas terrestris]